MSNKRKKKKPANAGFHVHYIKEYTMSIHKYFLPAIAVHSGNRQLNNEVQHRVEQHIEHLLESTYNGEIYDDVKKPLSMSEIIERIVRNVQIEEQDIWDSTSNDSPEDNPSWQLYTEHGEELMRHLYLSQMQVFTCIYGMLGELLFSNAGVKVKVVNYDVQYQEDKTSITIELATTNKPH